MSCGCGGNCGCSTEVSQFNQVRNWMKAINQSTPNVPMIPDLDTIKLRIALIQEELDELREACGMTKRIWPAAIEDIMATVGDLYENEEDFTNEWSDPELTKVNLVEVLDAFTDLLVVVQGGGVSFGLDLDKGFEEVQRSNDTKIIDGFARESDGKWMKGPSYTPPNLQPVLDIMIENPMD